MGGRGAEEAEVCDWLVAWGKEESWLLVGVWFPAPGWFVLLAPGMLGRSCSSCCQEEWWACPAGVSRGGASLGWAVPLMVACSILLEVLC